ncbi:MAG: hypothetical protein ABI895_01215 [Deltaproteobacteria bacterium]
MSSHRAPILQSIQRGVRLSPLLALVLCACGEAEGGGSYSREIKPLLDRRCSVCHFTGNGYADTEDPYDPERGIVGGPNEWYTGHDHGPPLNIAPGDPDNSFVFEKLTNLALQPEACPTWEQFTPEGCESFNAGFFMPPAPRRLKDVQIEMVRQWILDGAETEAFYDTSRSNGADYSVANLLGDYSRYTDRRGRMYPPVTCLFIGGDPGCVQCVSCHRKDGPYHPQGVSADLLVNVRAEMRNDLMLVAPGKPEESFLMMKLEATQFTSDVGAPMPHGYEPFSEEQVAHLREWIVEGAKKD